jgi:hypothetical protein
MCFLRWCGIGGHLPMFPDHLSSIFHGALVGADSL